VTLHLQVPALLALLLLPLLLLPPWACCLYCCLLPNHAQLQHPSPA
jgi:hypothetical protein